MANLKMTWAIVPSGVEFRLQSQRLLGSAKVLPPGEWSTQESSGDIVALSQLKAWVDAGIAKEMGDSVVAPHAAVAGLTEAKARRLGLPASPPYILDLQHSGTLDQDQFRFASRWVALDGIPATSARREGSILHVGGHAWRLPKVLYTLAEAIDAFNAAAPEGHDARLRHWATVHEALPTEARESVRADTYITTTRISHASAFSLALRTATTGLEIDPVLFGPECRTSNVTSDDMRAATVSEQQQLLPPDYQRVFCEKRFREFDQCQSQYALGSGWYVVIDEDVRKALDVVREVQGADPKTRREFARNPRSFLRERLGSEYPEEQLESLFVETVEYSQRVREIGLWQPMVLPWVQKSGEKWLPERFGVSVGGKLLTLESDDVKSLQELISKAVDAGEPTVAWQGQEIPATQATLAALGHLAAIGGGGGGTVVDPGEPSTPDPEGMPDAIVLRVEDNFDHIGFQRGLTPRSGGSGVVLPHALRSVLKQHQVEGLHWMIAAWTRGLSGVLLADDMGLGKTLQALTFLAWLRERPLDARRRRGPIGVVAPVGLLRNWEEEHGRHLHSPGLGQALIAYGPKLANLRLAGGAETKLGGPVLDASQLQAADWILTTYETIRDYQHSFGSVRFAALVFDEAQKVKTPGTLTTEASKAMNADFVITMTGTPIENRLADLWTIMDLTQPGFLGDLSKFSQTYERDPDIELLKELKSRLTVPSGDSPPHLLRRMKAERLDGLPEKSERVIAVDMPAAQAKAYRDVIAAARQAKGRGAILKALQALRSVSLHPVHPDQADSDRYIDESARFRACFSVLDSIADRGEKVLIFLESLDMQPVLAGLIQRRYRMREQPALISGEVSGDGRQRRVNAFQAGDKGFDTLIISPRAGGVGLTLTAANHVIHLSRWWNPAVEDQCTDRVYRIGQQRPVNVYCLQAIHPDPDIRDSSFDLRLHSLLERKRALSRDFLVPPTSDEDVEALFRETVDQVGG